MSSPTLTSEGTADDDDDDDDDALVHSAPAVYGAVSYTHLRAHETR